MKQLFYLLLGLPSSGRREILLNLASESSSFFAFPHEETPHPLSSDLASLGSTCHWQWENNSFSLESPVPADVEQVFLLTDHNLDPIDQIEATKDFISANGLALGRIFTIVHCGLAEQYTELMPWYDGCIHFSDVVFLNRRENVSQKWIRAFQEDFRQQYFPCFFEFVKKGKVNNPIHVLDPTPRRLSLYFDEEFDLPRSDEDDDMEDVTLAEDPYLAKHPTGERCKPLPDTGFILSDASQSSSA
ncbi:MAG: hypothetical protein VB980_03560 [Opitutales bacterium]